MLNYEEALVERFGGGEGLAESLRFPVFVSSVTPDAVDALKKTYRRLPKKVTSFIRAYDASMPEEVQSDWRYDFRVILLPQTGPKTEADAVMRFVREEDMTDEQREARDVVETVIRTRQVPVKNLRLHKPVGPHDGSQTSATASGMSPGRPRMRRHGRRQPLAGCPSRAR